MTKPQSSTSFDVTLTRRRFLGWSATLGAGLAAGVPWPAEARPAGLGIVGLGERGRRLLERVAAAPATRLAGICDRRPAALSLAGRLVDLPADLERATRVEHLCTSPAVDGLVATVPSTALPEAVGIARAAETPILLARPFGDLDLLVECAGSGRVELVPALHVSLGATPRDLASVEAVRLELAAPDLAALDVLAAEALELATTLVGGRPAEIRAIGGPARGPATVSLRAAVRLEPEVSVDTFGGAGSRRLDVVLRVVPGARAAGRLALQSGGRSIVGGLIPRLDATPNLADLAAFGTGDRSGGAIGLELARLVRSRDLFRAILSHVGAG